MTIPEAINWGNSLKKVTSVKHRTLLLRVAHGDIYTKEKLVRYRMSDNPDCPRCGEIEDLQHKIYSCPYTQRIWSKVFEVTRKIVTNHYDGEIENKVLGAHIGTSPLLLSIHAEIIQFILLFKDDASHLVRPANIVKMALANIMKLEKKQDVKGSCSELINELENWGHFYNNKKTALKSN